MSDTIYLDLPEVADEWEELEDELSSAHSDDDTDRVLDLRADRDKYTQLCNELGLEPQDPATLRWYADNTGPTIVREDTFTDYARDYAEEIGAISEDWPSCYVNWERAADVLRADFRTISYDGHDWLVRP